jgi:DNA-3-methyladenine glycosylase
LCAAVFGWPQCEQATHLLAASRPDKQAGAGAVVGRLGRSFFSRYSPDVAQELLACVLVRRVRGKTLSGRIVEVEAYRGSDDPASHSYRGPTKRSSIMFGEAGHAYVYFSYGNHWCLNITAEPEGQPGAVLIRALEPVEGIRQMVRNRGITDLGRLTNGPGKLTKALSIDGSFNGEDLVRSRRLYVMGPGRPVRVEASSRIGVSKGREQQWRYFVEGNPFVSKR